MRLAAGLRPGIERWFVALLIVDLLTQASTALLRPMLSYRALEIGVTPAFLGVALGLQPLTVSSVAAQARPGTRRPRCRSG
jgi:hypothetical protein